MLIPEEIDKPPGGRGVHPTDHPSLAVALDPSPRLVHTIVKRTKQIK
jgi:hypothetical protein